MRRTDPYWECRRGGLGHVWDDGIPVPPNSRTTVLRDAIVSRCLRCGTEKIQKLNSYGDIDSTRYHHPSDYNTPVEERMSASEIRRMRLKNQRAKNKRKLRSVS